MKIKTANHIFFSFINARPVLKGYLFAFISTLGMSNVYVFSKAALQEVHLIQFGFYWFGFAMLWSLSYLIYSGKIRTAKNLNRKSIVLLVIIGLLEMSAAVTMFISISLIENPAVVSFLANLTPIFVTLFGIYFLKERFNLVEGLGIVLTITGAILISYTGEQSLKDIFAEGTGWILISSFLLSVSIIIAKSRITRIDPSILTINRIAYLFTFSSILMITEDYSLQIPGTALFNIIIGSIMGPFITGLAQYTALKYIEASRTMIIQATRGLFVVVGAILYLGILPEEMQIIGGIITIVGVIVIEMGKIRFRRKRI